MRPQFIFISFTDHIELTDVDDSTLTVSTVQNKIDTIGNSYWVA